MDTDPQVGVEVYKITRDDYGRSPHGVLTTVAATGVLTTLWVLVSWLFDRFIPYFRSEFTPFGSQAWLIHAVVLGFFWSILMVLWGSFRRKRLEFEIEIMPDQIAKRRNKGSGLIYRDDVSGLREFRILGRSQGLNVISKYHRFFIPAGHARYAEIKQRLEGWIRTRAHRAPVTADFDIARMVREERESH